MNFNRSGTVKFSIIITIILFIGGQSLINGQTANNKKRLDWPKNWTKYLGKKITIEGSPANLKLGAVLTGDGPDIWIDGLDSWPDNYFIDGKQGKKVRVTGTVIYKDDLPVFHKDEEGLPKAGIPIENKDDINRAKRRYLLKNAKWDLIAP